MSDLWLCPSRGLSHVSYCGGTAFNLADSAGSRVPADVGELTVLLASLTPPPGGCNLSPLTVRSYTDDCALLAVFRVNKGMPIAVTSIKREHEASSPPSFEPTSASSAATRYRSLQQFFR